MIVGLQVMVVVTLMLMELILFSRISGRKLRWYEVLLGMAIRVIVVNGILFLNYLLKDNWGNYYIAIFVDFFLLSYLFLRPLSKTLLIFYSLLPMTLLDLFSDSLSFGAYAFEIEDVLAKGNNLGVGIERVIAIVLLLLFLHYFHYDFSKLRRIFFSIRDKKFLYLVNWLMACYYGTTQLLLYMETGQAADVLVIRQFILIFYLLIFMSLIAQLDKNIRETLKEKLDFQKELQLQHLEQYSQQVEGLYREVRGFRHDYTNLLTTLQVGIEENNLTLVKEIYDTVLKDSSKHLRHPKYDMGRLVQIDNNALKSLLASKIAQATEHHVAVSLEVPEVIRPKGMELVDFITIVAILCDNAYEAALETETAIIRLSYFTLEQKQVFIIENSTQQESVDISSLYQFEASSKGEHRGIGLYTVLKILEHYPGVSLQTRSQHHTFCQVLEIQLVDE
ncbi:GHKL domain-containing protein [Streptococcus sp. zg-86]|uniref:GHKL domain-containing protein n=1 Tax=Streptococcus zhangguiae TaxID=2664091 RepID=A0A6I4RAR7_9STRE|nr:MULTISPECIES: GHKL domain-containing protein [unclassified Streptococcus]MTB64572.1 GHKL domain-containing protein [Streptococcus sp. zg-86]MTB90738.1 GHKL domain-containing protein [Streptococcus sp. zg-36]MWV56559.1 GHKL domain-containing protein [Streptococcus sp. zg-70]QTH47236.1 GHKL domain-containing protein [Streptococcus sp. zg-86]